MVAGVEGVVAGAVEEVFGRVVVPLVLPPVLVGAKNTSVERVAPSAFGARLVPDGTVTAEQLAVTPAPACSGQRVKPVTSMERGRFSNSWR